MYFFEEAVVEKQFFIRSCAQNFVSLTLRQPFISLSDFSHTIVLFFVFGFLVTFAAIAIIIVFFLIPIYALFICSTDQSAKFPFFFFILYPTNREFLIQFSVSQLFLFPK